MNSRTKKSSQAAIEAKTKGRFISAAKSGFLITQHAKMLTELDLCMLGTFSWLWVPKISLVLAFCVIPKKNLSSRGDDQNGLKQLQNFHTKAEGLWTPGPKSPAKQLLKLNLKAVEILELLETILIITPKRERSLAYYQVYSGQNAEEYISLVLFWKDSWLSLWCLFSGWKDPLNLMEEKAGKSLKLMGMGINIINELQ